MRVWKSPTESRKEMTIDRDVANPFMMLSAYLITSAVISPPRTCVATVAHAATVKFANKLVNEGTAVTFAPWLTTIGAKAGNNENKLS